jgi:nucleotide-binding universal stress UspA family protein
MKLLLAVDSSAASDFAAKEVAARPWPAGTTVQVVSVVEPAYGWSVPGLEESLQRSAQDAVAGAAETLRQSGLSVTTSILTGDPKAKVIDQAAEMGADLAVVGSHDVSDLARFLLGSVARTVLRFAPCSVEIVRGEPGPGTRRVLLATDGSEFSQAAVRSVASRPWPAGSVIRILSVVELHIPLMHTPDYFDPKAMEDARGEAMQHAQEAVDFAEKVMGDAGLEVSTSIAIPTATPKELILKEASEWGADLIVMGSHGRRGVSRFLLGSVSEAVALHAGCSVEIIR